MQNTISQVLEARHETSLNKAQQAIGGFVFSSQYSMSDLQQQPNMKPAFLENLLGAQISLPHLAQRADFRKLALELLRQISPTQRISKAALDASAEQTIIRNANLRTDHALSGGDVAPCATSTQSPMRKESCLLIKKTWLKTGGNISLVSRHLGIWRTTFYKHVKKMT